MLFDSSGKKEVLRKRLKNYQKQLHLKRENLAVDGTRKEKKSKDLDFICVIDFEATCTDAAKFDYPHEIIEFPIVLINAKTKQIVI